MTDKICPKCGCKTLKDECLTHGEWFYHCEKCKYQYTAC